ncbi:DIBOA-glucoside dioxygenase BX6-like [Phalaenopsis equestris]|uniref:DIBOA-glucoside dioxygenase BX6-like n=1 Tax=Phalaenopsis equestris TaxID=78828 RepID=UPI0009E586AC|nr:DIBOA-glucoside dioxygenase BX6-like [Phalaenopsis equestris]
METRKWIQEWAFANSGGEIERLIVAINWERIRRIEASNAYNDEYKQRRFQQKVAYEETMVRYQKSEIGSSHVKKKINRRSRPPSDDKDGHIEARRAFGVTKAGVKCLVYGGASTIPFFFHQRKPSFIPPPPPPHHLAAAERSSFYSHHGGGVSYVSMVDLYRSSAASWRYTLQIVTGLTPPDHKKIPAVFLQELIGWDMKATKLARHVLRLLRRVWGWRGGIGQNDLFGGEGVGLPVQSTFPEQEGTTGVVEHNDSGLLTLLLQDEIGGLQVRKEGEDGEWWRVDVEPVFSFGYYMFFAF